MSFNYTPPPAEVTIIGNVAVGVLYAALIFLPNVKRGAWIGALDSAAITLCVASQADGDMGSLSAVILPPMWAVIGAIVGATVSFISKTIRSFLNKAETSETTSIEQNDHRTSK